MFSGPVLLTGTGSVGVARDSVTAWYRRAIGGDPEHPAHDFAVRRYERLANQMAGQIAALPEGEIGVDMRPQEAADILLATIEGLLVRGLTEPDLDVPGLVRLAVLRVVGG